MTPCYCLIIVYISNDISPKHVANEPQLSLCPAAYCFHCHSCNVLTDSSASQVLSAAEASVQQQNAVPQEPLCKYWVNAGNCLMGEACQFRHVLPSQLPELRKGWVVARYGSKRHCDINLLTILQPHNYQAALPLMHCCCQIWQFLKCILKPSVNHTHH